VSRPASSLSASLPSRRRAFTSSPHVENRLPDGRNGRKCIKPISSTSQLTQASGEGICLDPGESECFRFVRWIAGVLLRFEMHAGAAAVRCLPGGLRSITYGGYVGILSPDNPRTARAGGCPRLMCAHESTAEIALKAGATIVCREYRSS